MKIQLTLALAFLSIAPVVAFAETAEEQQACTPDAMNICGYAIPDRDRVTTCLYQNKSKISVACRAVLARYPQPGSTTVSNRSSAVR